jgi:dihydroneopterin aldolase
MSTITLNGMEFYAYHGCFREEAVVGTRFVVDLEMKVDFSKASQSDDLNDTVNYLEVYQLIKLCMQKKSKLLEHLSRHILLALMERFPQISEGTIKVAKMNPPLGGQLSSVSVTMNYDGKRFS